MDTDPKATLVRYLQSAREAMLWKLDGLSEYDARRPLTPTGTNLLGLIKHLASVELEYFGPTFGRETGVELPWYADDADHNADMWAEPGETREQIIGLYHRAWEVAAETFAEKALEDTGVVGHWPAPDNQVTLHQILVHVATETHRHAGHADILRELIDGGAGWREGRTNLPDDGYDWSAHVARVQQAADQFNG